MLGAYALLVELADAGLGDGFDEQDLIGQLPLGEGTGQVLLQFFIRRIHISSRRLTHFAAFFHQPYSCVVFQLHFAVFHIDCIH